MSEQDCAWIWQGAPKVADRTYCPLLGAHQTMSGMRNRKHLLIALPALVLVLAVGAAALPGAQWPLQPGLVEPGSAVLMAVPIKVQGSRGSGHEEVRIDPFNAAVFLLAIASDGIGDKVFAVGRAVWVTLPAAPGGRTYSLSRQLPQGLASNGTTRARSGIPQAVMVRRPHSYRMIDDHRVGSDVEIRVEVQNSPSFPDTVSIEDMIFVKGESMSSPVLPEAVGGDPPLTYSFTAQLPEGLSFDATARVVSGTAAGILTSRPYAYLATDSQGDRSDPLVFNIDIQVDATPSFAGANFQDLEFDQYETITPVPLPRATGGNGELTYSLAGQPRGLMLDADGAALIGKPEEATLGAVVTLTATDIDGDKVSAEFGITVNGPPPGPLTLASKAIGDQVYVLQQAVPTLQLPKATGGSEEITYSLSPFLPVGLEFDAAARTITGTPVQLLDETAYQYTATAGSETDIAGFKITVVSHPASVPSFRQQTIDNQVFTVGEDIGTLELPRASYGYGRLTYSLKPDLPEGLALILGQRQITGTPVAESAATEYTYTVTDASGTMTSLIFTIEIEANTAPSLAEASVDTLSLIEGQQVGPIILPAAAGGNAPLVYSITPALPEGIVFDSSAHAIAGVPTESAGASSYIYAVTDQDGDTDSLEFALEIAAWTRVYMLNSVTGQVVDLYLDGTRILDDLVVGSQGDIVLGAGERVIDIVASDAEGNQQPLLRVPVSLKPHRYHYLLVYHDGTQLRLMAKDVAESPTPAGFVEVYVAHGSAALGRVAVRVTDPSDHSRVVFRLTTGIEVGQLADFVSLGAAVHNIEVVSAADDSQVEVYRLNLRRQRNQVVALVLSSKAGLIAVNQQGQVIQPLIITASEGEEELPDKPLVLDGNFPNPFNPVTRIQFHLGEPARVILMVMDLLGRKVVEIPEQDFKAGSNQSIEISMDHLASGLYLYRVQATMESGVHYKTGRMTLSK